MERKGRRSDKEHMEQYNTALADRLNRGNRISRSAYTYSVVTSQPITHAPAALLIRKSLRGPIAFTALSPMLLNGTKGPDSTL